MYKIGDIFFPKQYIGSNNLDFLILSAQDEVGFGFDEISISETGYYTEHDWDGLEEFDDHVTCNELDRLFCLVDDELPLKIKRLWNDASRQCLALVNCTSKPRVRVTFDDLTEGMCVYIHKNIALVKKKTEKDCYTTDIILTNDDLYLIDDDSDSYSKEWNLTFDIIDPSIFDQVMALKNKCWMETQQILQANQLKIIKE